MSERDIRALLALIEQQLGTSWLDITDFLRDTNTTDAIEQRLRMGDYAGVIREVEAAARQFAAETKNALVQAGRAQAAWMDTKVPDKLIRFDMDNPRFVRAAQRNELELVTGLTQETRESIHAVLIDGQARGENPRVMARSIRDSIGLTPRDEAALRSYRTALEQGDFSNALGRQLSSGHADRTLRRLQRDDGALTPAQVDDITERYRQNLLTTRAETIAQTESARNVHAGLAESVTQALERGDIRVEQLSKEWIHGRASAHARRSHQALHRTQVPWNGMFDVGGVQMRYPHDPTAPASEVIRCGCTFATILAA
jgi:hypothetical protein